VIKSKRKFPSLPYFWSLIDFSLPSLNPYRGKLNRAQNIADLAKVAKKRVPKVVFDYVEGSAVEEVSYRRQRECWDRVEINSRVLRDVSKIDTSEKISFHQRDTPD